MFSGPSVQTKAHRFKPGPSNQEKVTAETHSWSGRPQRALSHSTGDGAVMRVLEWEGGLFGMHPLQTYGQGRQASTQPLPGLSWLLRGLHLLLEVPQHSRAPGLEMVLLLRERGQRALVLPQIPSPATHRQPEQPVQMVLPGILTSCHRPTLLFNCHPLWGLEPFLPQQSLEPSQANLAVLLVVFMKSLFPGVGGPAWLTGGLLLGPAVDSDACRFWARV